MRTSPRARIDTLAEVVSLSCGMMNVPLPTRRERYPSFASSSSTRVMVERLTPNSSASRRSGASRVPTA